MNMGAKFAHSAKSVKLGTHVHWTVSFGKHQWKHSGKYMLPLNPILWPPLDTPFGHNSVNAWPIFIILVSIRPYVVFEGWQSIGVTSRLHSDLYPTYDVRVFP